MTDISDSQFESQILGDLGVKGGGILGVTGIGLGSEADLSGNFFNFMLVAAFIILAVIIVFLVEAINQFNEASSKPSQGCPYATCQGGGGTTDPTGSTGVPKICVDPTCSLTTIPMKAIGFD